MQKRHQPILILDDEEGWLEFAYETLKQNEYEVYMAPDISTAEETLTDQQTPDIRLVLVNARLLEVKPSPIEALHRSKNAKPKGGETQSTLQSENQQEMRSIIALVSTNLTPHRSRGLFKLGVKDVVNKPFDPDGLLALVEQIQADYRTVPPRREAKRSRSNLILIVDDDSDWRKNLVDLLPPLEEQVEQADTFEAAKSKLQNQKYDLVIFDLRLEDKDEENFQGMELVELVRDLDETRHSFTQIILVTAYGKSEHILGSFRDYEILNFFDKKYMAPVRYREQIIEALARDSG